MQHGRMPQTLWSLRAFPELAEAFSHTLDGIVGFASRGLLRPIATLEDHPWPVSTRTSAPAS